MNPRLNPEEKRIIREMVDVSGDRPVLGVSGLIGMELRRFGYVLSVAARYWRLRLGEELYL